ncbi:MAG: hypothetical protein H7039_24355 [Bryobacteraceae bacterium]|nr:hypothetical protein [Bryobacteraceae bacterium]
MRRRTFAQSVLTILSWLPLGGVRVWAQAAMFPGSHDRTLKDLAATVLPESLGRAGTDQVAAQFVRWVREYRPGAELQTGYGFTRVRFQTPSPAGSYLTQLGQLREGALAADRVVERRSRIAESLKAAKVMDLFTIPQGTDVVVDLMSFYFNGSAANDLAYSAAIGREKCRTLEDSGKVPMPLKGTRNANG